MPDLFQYINFREFLKDFYDEQKARNKTFSYQAFADKAGFTNKGFVYNIVKGTKPLSPSNVYKLVSALKLTGTEKRYFEVLVSHNQADTKKEQEQRSIELEKLKNEPRSLSVYQLQRDQYEFYSCWYHCVIRSLLDMFRFKDDYATLANRVYPSITVDQAKRSILLLERLHLINRKEDGYYEVTNKTISSGKDLSLAVLNFHKDTCELAQKALNTVQIDKRNVTGLTLGISEILYSRICEEIQLFQKRLLSLAEQDEGSDRVYQMNFHLFPLSKHQDQLIDEK